MFKGSLLAACFVSICAITTNAKSSSAPVTAYVCNACGLADLRQEALDEGNGDHYFYDFTYHKLSHYRISGQFMLKTQSGAMMSRASSRVSIVPVSRAEGNVFDAVEGFYSANNNSIYASAVGVVDAIVPVSSISARRANTTATLMTGGSRKMTAFDMVQVPVYRQMAIDTQKSFSNFDAYPNVIRASAGTVLSMVNYVPFMKVPIIMKITLEFPDGSTSVIQYDFKEGDFHYVEGSSHDAVGNPIPESPAEASGIGSKTYVFPATAAGAAAGAGQIDNLQKMGIDIPTQVFRSSWIIACSNVGGNLPRCSAWPR